MQPDLQVYLARWHETPVAVKVLIDKDAMANAGPKEMLTLPDSLLAKLDEVGAGALAGTAGCAVVVVVYSPVRRLTQTAGMLATAAAGGQPTGVPAPPECGELHGRLPRAALHCHRILLSWQPDCRAHGCQERRAGGSGADLAAPSGNGEERVHVCMQQMAQAHRCACSMAMPALYICYITPLCRHHPSTS